MKLKTSGKNILDGDGNIYAVCDEPEKAIKMMDRAWFLNDVKRQYTASARLFAQVENLPGFKWSEAIIGTLIFGCSMDVAW